jgi:hypothetical protein
MSFFPVTVRVVDASVGALVRFSKAGICRQQEQVIMPNEESCLPRITKSGCLLQILQTSDPRLCRHRGVGWGLDLCDLQLHALGF